MASATDQVDELFDDDDAEVQPVSPSAPAPTGNTTVVLHRPNTGGRPPFKVFEEKGDGLFSCGNCQWFDTPWRRNLTDAKGEKRSCKDFGVTETTKPCSFSVNDPFKKWSPKSFDNIGISKDLTFAEIQLTRVLLNRREQELQLAASVPFSRGDKVQFIHKNKYFIGVVESFNKQTVYVKIKEPHNGLEHILPLPIGTVTKV